MSLDFRTSWLVCSVSVAVGVARSLGALGDLKGCFGSKLQKIEICLVGDRGDTHGGEIAHCRNRYLCRLKRGATLCCHQGESQQG